MTSRGGVITGVVLAVAAWSLALIGAAAATAVASEAETDRILYVVNPGGAFQLQTIEADGSGLTVARRLDHSDEGPPTGMPPFSLSPDGESIGYFTFVQHEGQHRQQLIHAPLYGDGPDVRSEPGTYASPTYSPSGDKLVFTGDDGEGGRALAEFDLKTRQTTALGARNTSVGPPRYMPDGGSVLYFDPGPIATQGQDGVFALSLADGTRSRVTPETIVSFDISPDGRELLYSHPTLSALDIETGAVRKLIPSPQEGGPNYTYSSARYSPDGERIVFDFHETHSRPLVTRLATIRADGSGFEVIPGTEGAFSPEWGASEPPANHPDGSPFPGAGTDRKVARPRLTGRTVQRLNRRWPAVRVFIGAAEPGQGRAVARIRAAGGTVRLTAPGHSFDAGRREKLKLHPVSAKARGLLKAAISRRGHLRATVTAWITDGAGNRSRRTKRIKLV